MSTRTSIFKIFFSLSGDNPRIYNLSVSLYFFCVPELLLHPQTARAETCVAFIEPPKKGFKPKVGLNSASWDGGSPLF